MSHHELSFGIKFDSKIEGRKTGIFWGHSFLISQFYRRFGSIHRLSFGFIIAYWQD